MNPRIISDIVSILEESLPSDLYALDYTHDHYLALLGSLNIDTNEALFNDKKGSIRKALVKFFSKTYQDIDVKAAFEKCVIKKHFTDPSKSEAYDRMLHKNTLLIIDILKRKFEFSPLAYLISIPEDIRTRIMHGFVDANDAMETARQITRRQFEQIFKLDERDIIFFLRGRISIRYYTPPKKLPPGADKRFAGESVEKMEEMYSTYFPDGAWDHIEPILGEVIAEKLNFAVIDNATFTRTFIPVFRTMIEILLLEIIDPTQRDAIEGFTGYVLRQHFHQIFVCTAKNLLQFVEERDKNAEKFIKYFNEDIVLDSNGNKIQKYAIVDSKQQKWNYSSIVSVMMQFKQAKLKIENQKEAILSAHERVEICQEELNSEKNNKQDVLDHLNEVEEALGENDTAILKLKSKETKTPEEAVALKSEINKLNYHHTELLENKKSVHTQLELAKNRITNKTNELARHENKHTYEKKSLATIMEQTAPIFETYETVVEALATVLTKR
ncbi:hypothetical protein [Sulfuricurvum sp.]|uniref:hypothetical protein n=1 Tax=Sulfuricurvum sp. TaxID=2025608 RepID=UPI0026297C33|nr:hypothetical protein [Sulfuricurvum sp.]MDD4884156.1 hypothetical protein [Sulfuricurvum sp.]